MSLYTIGNWTVDELITPASSTEIEPAVATVTRAEYAVQTTDPSTRASQKSLALVNTTSNGLTVPETLKFGVQSMQNVYADTGISIQAQLPLKTGFKCLQRIDLVLKATNSVSGQEFLVPQKAWLVYETPQHDVVTPTAVEYTLKRLLGAALMGVSGHTFADRITAIAKGDLDPSTLV